MTSTTIKKSASDVARDFYYFSQFGLTRAPVTMGDGGDQRLRRFTAALCHVAGADGEVMSKEEQVFIMGYCASKGYPQSIIDDIPAMCRAAEAMSPEEGASSVKGLLTMGTLKKTARQVVYDAIRSADADGLCDKETKAVEDVAKVLGLSGEELASIHELIQKEKELKAERIGLLFPDGHPCLP